MRGELAGMAAALLAFAASPSLAQPAQSKPAQAQARAHAQPDDYRSDPAGASQDRIACGDIH
jgi:hypothetical protein